MQTLLPTCWEPAVEAHSDGASVGPQRLHLSLSLLQVTNTATESPEITYSVDQKLNSIINYPEVSTKTIENSYDVETKHSTKLFKRYAMLGGINSGQKDQRSMKTQSTSG